MPVLRSNSLPDRHGQHPWHCQCCTRLRSSAIEVQRVCSQVGQAIETVRHASIGADYRLDKTVFVNGHTKIEHRASVHDESSSLLNRPCPPPIQDICETFLDLGLCLALQACKDAIQDWGRPTSEITHLICTTCTGSSHPGYDLYLHQRLGLGREVERTLLHGVGCAGGLSIVRLAKQTCMAAEHMGRKARVLVVALEVASSMLRTELQSIDEEAARGGGTPNIASVIFSDAASAMLVGNGLEDDGEYIDCFC